MPNHQPHTLHEPNRSLRCDVYEDVTILPMTYVDREPMTSFALGAFADGKAIAQAHRYAWGLRFSRQLPYVPAQKKSTQEVIYGGVFWGHWGHFLTETLQRLWYAKHNPLPIIWLRAKHNPKAAFFADYHMEVFKGLGLKNTHIYVNQPTQFAKVHFPEPGFGLLHYAHAEHMNFLAYYEGKVRQGRYVYFSRRRYNNCLNEKSIEDMLQSLGWEIVNPEQFSVAEQLKIITGAEVCMMIAGSAQHSLALVKHCKTRFIVIPRVQNITYSLIAGFASDNYYLLHLEKKIINMGMENAKEKFSLDVDKLQDIVQKTENFTSNLHAFADILQKNNIDTSEYARIPDIYYTADVNVSAVEKYFYQALFLAKNKKYHAAYAIFMKLYNENLLQEFMFDYFFYTVEKYDEERGRQTKLRFSKEHFQLQKATKELEENPSNGNNYIRLAQLLLQFKRHEAAIHVLQRALKIFPKWALPYAAVAQCYAGMQDMDKAVYFAKIAFEFDPKNRKIKDVLACCLSLQKNNHDGN